MLNDVAPMYEHFLEAPHISQAEDPLKLIRGLCLLTDGVKYSIKTLEGLLYRLEEANFFDSVEVVDNIVL